MRSTIRTVSLIFCVISLMMLMFLVFVWMLLSEIIPEEIEEMDDILGYVFFALLIIIVITITLTVLLPKTIGSESAKHHGNMKQGTTMRMKKCLSCGTPMDITEHVCPRCRSVQPWTPEQSEKWKKR